MEYQFHPVSCLPMVDLSQTLVSPFLTLEQHDRFLNWCSRASKAFSWCNRIGLACAIATICAPGAVGHAVAIPSLVLCLPNILLTAVVASRDMCVILMNEHEFWLFTAMNAAYWFVMGGTLGGVRWCACVPCWMNTQLIISVDANIRTLLKMLPASMIWIPGAICICIVSFIPVIDIESSHFDSLLPSGRMVLTLINILTNIYITLCLFTVRRCFPKRSVLTKEFADTRLIPCAMIRAKLYMRLAPTRIQPGTSIQKTNRPSRAKSLFRVRIRPSVTIEQCGMIQQLEFVPRKIMSIDATLTLVLSIVPPSSPKLSPLGTLMLYTIGIGGLIFSVDVVCQVPIGDGDDIVMVAWLALGATIVFMSPFVLRYQRTMVKTLITNFDVLFLWIQALIGWLGFSYSIEWDVRSVAALSLLLWVQFTLLIDALTPVVRARYRFRKAFLTPIIVLLVAGGVGLVVNVASSSTPFVPDHDLFCVHAVKKSHCIQTASFVLHRLFTLVMGTLRLLWVLPLGPDEELLYLRAVVRFSVRSRCCHTVAAIFHQQISKCWNSRGQ